MGNSKKKEVRGVSFREDNGIVREGGDNIIDAYNPVKMRKIGRKTINMDKVTEKDSKEIGE